MRVVNKREKRSAGRELDGTARRLIAAKTILVHPALALHMTR